MIALRKLEDVSVEARRVLLRADLNVPLQTSDGRSRVADDTRIRGALETIEELRSRGASIVLVSHLGRPKDREAALSMAPIADALRELTGARVTLAPAVVGEQVEAQTRRLDPGAILVLENVRYEPGETSNDPQLAKQLAKLGDVFVNDAFGTAHRAHASTEGVAHLLPCAAGRLIERETLALSRLLQSPSRPLVAVLGGAKVSDKLGLVEQFLAVADVLLIGGAMSSPFLAAQGHSTGAYPACEDDVQSARRALQRAGRDGCDLRLPEDLLVAKERSCDATVQTTETSDVPDGLLGLDIGPRTAARYAQAIGDAGTVFWNGPMGVFELEPFSHGTRAVARAVARTHATSVVGGGETVAAVRELGLEDRVDHLSTGGGATLAFLQGRPLPGLEVLRVSGAEPSGRPPARGSAESRVPA